VAHHPRTFPPPGTLVVVQGVVHTTDVPRPPTPALANPGANSPPPAPVPAISSSSIDVLGTLLTCVFSLFFLFLFPSLGLPF
jgi:hypothetical protein